MVIRTAKRTHLTRSCVAVPQRAVVSSKEFSTQNLNGRATSAIDVHSQPLLGHRSERILDSAGSGPRRRAGCSTGRVRDAHRQLLRKVSRESKFKSPISRETVHVVLAVSTSTGTLLFGSWVKTGRAFRSELPPSSTPRKFPLEMLPVLYNEKIMRAFQILINGKRICVAGIPGDGVLSTTITYVPFRKRRETRLYVGGLELPKNEHVFWKEAILHAGDEVRIKIVELKTVDRPLRRYPRDLVAEVEAEKRQARKLAKKFGWRIQEDRKSK